jgi:hypothetical protein
MRLSGQTEVTDTVHQRLHQTVTKWFLAPAVLDVASCDTENGNRIMEIA